MLGLAWVGVRDKVRLYRVGIRVYTVIVFYFHRFGVVCQVRDSLSYLE